MNNYQNKARDEILDIITVRCKDCKRIMDRIKSLPWPEFKPSAFYCVYCDRSIEFLSVTTDPI